MNLKLVTFEGDNTQFLVNAEHKNEAIAYANEANIQVGEMYDSDYDLHNFKDEWYTVEDVDWNLLREIIRRDDYLFTTSNAVVFND